ncbi:hypothetical protein MtrunA17_Chr4g0055181 [Medicago truncatula]|uniref:Uncharacterized protein n=1 Tax=Medicago truncatula TaxID=3880 RepID=A0A396IC35_MEDTR|nr:hypothetical protein MtrunA17_Chr4g0055181 [Medicago truncatula]
MRRESLEGKVSLKTSLEGSGEVINLVLRSVLNVIWMIGKWKI